jgi:Tol biopolymer transport system component
MGEFPTRTVPLTSTGSIVGTLNYMSPEQLEGAAIDARSDVFAFGAVLFEMLSGRRAFNAHSHAGLIAAILNDEPPVLDQIADVRSPLPASAHRALDRLLRRCLAKDPNDRWQCAADLAAELHWIDEERLRLAGQTETPPGAQPSVSGLRTRERWWMAAAVAGLLGMGALGAWALTRRPPELRSVTFDLAAPDGLPFRNGPGLLSVSPDGKHVVAAVGAGPETSQLAVRSLDSAEFRVLAGTEGAWQPFWSPDSRSIGFSDTPMGGNLKRVDLAGGAVQTLAAENRARGSWGSSGLILLGGGPAGLFTVPDTGGSPTPVAKVDAAAGEVGYTWPLFLPDGRRFLYLAQYSDRQKTAIFLGSLDSASRTRVVAADSSFELSAGHLLFQRNGSLYAQPFDVDAGRVTGDARPMVEGLVYNSTNGRTAVSASTGPDALVYRLGRAVIGRQNTLTWLDMTGKPLGNLGGPDGATRQQSLSPDGTRVAQARGRPGGDVDIYVLDSQRDLPTRLTSDGADDTHPIWSPDGADIYFSSMRKGKPGIYRRSAGGAGNDELVFESPAAKIPVSISPDGKLLLLSMRENQRSQIWGLPLVPDGKPYPIRQTAFNELNPVLSPDGQWLAYVADDVGTRQVYVEPFPATGVRERISTTPVDSMPLWSEDGRSIFYLTGEGTVAAVDVNVTGAAIRAGAERVLFEATNVENHSRALAFDPDRRRFLAITSTSREAESTPLRVLLNWTATLRASSATGR